MLRLSRIPTLLVLLAALPCGGTTTAGAENGTAMPPTAQLFRSVDDPALATRWLLMRDPRHPGAPGRMVEAPARIVSPGGLNSAADHGDARKQTGLQRKAKPVVRVGDEILVVSENPDSQLTLHARALSAGCAGDKISARIDVFHREVHARVLAAGRVEMLAPSAAYGRQP